MSHLEIIERVRSPTGEGNNVVEVEGHDGNYDVADSAEPSISHPHLESVDGLDRVGACLPCTTERVVLEHLLGMGASVT